MTNAPPSANAVLFSNVPPVIVSTDPALLITAPASWALLPLIVPLETVSLPLFMIAPPLPELLAPVIVPVYAVLLSMIFSVPFTVMTLPFAAAEDRWRSIE